MQETTVERAKTYPMNIFS